MSGIEILGIAASVVSIAELGAELSVKLFTFSRKVKHADKSIDSISKQIAFTGSVLQQLGSVLNDHENAKLCKPEYTASAKSLVEACKKIFTELNDAIDGNSKYDTVSGNIVLGLRQRLKFPFLQPQIDLLQTKLESLQSSLQVMLQALVLAVGLKNHEAIPLLREQRTMLETLVEEQTSMAKRLTQLTHRASASQDGQAPQITLATGMQAQAASASDTRKDARLSSDALKLLPMHLHHHAEEIFDHSRMLTVLMHEIDDARYKVDKQIRDASKNGLFTIHYDQWSSRFRDHVAAKEWSTIFADHPKLQRLWHLRHESALLWQKAANDLSLRLPTPIPVPEPCRSPHSEESNARPVTSDTASSASSIIVRHRTVRADYKQLLKRAEEAQLDMGYQSSQGSHQEVLANHSQAGPPELQIVGMNTTGAEGRGSANSSGASTPIYGMSYDQTSDSIYKPKDQEQESVKANQEILQNLFTAQQTPRPPPVVHGNAQQQYSYKLGHGDDLNRFLMNVKNSAFLLSSERPSTTGVAARPLHNSSNMAEPTVNDPDTTPGQMTGELRDNEEASSSLRSTKSAWSRTFVPRMATLRKDMHEDIERDDPDDEDASYVSNVLRAYYEEKDRPFPAWLPPEPRRPARVPVSPQSIPPASHGRLPDLWDHNSASSPTAYKADAIATLRRMNKQRSAAEHIPSSPSSGSTGDPVAAGIAAERLRARLRGTDGEQSGKLPSRVINPSDHSPTVGVGEVKGPVDRITGLISTWTALGAEELQLLSQVQNLSRT